MVPFTANYASAGRSLFLKILKITIAFGLIVSGPITSVPAAEGSLAVPKVSLGLLTTQDPDFFIDTFEPTIARLRGLFRKTDFVTHELDYQTLLSAIEKRTVDFIILPSGPYASLEKKIAARPLAARKRPEATSSDFSAGGTVIVRPDSKIQAFSDLKNARIAASSRESFEDWLVLVGEIKRETGISPSRLEQNAIFTEFKQPDPATLVASGHADAGFLKACELEQLTAQGAFSETDFRVISPKSNPSLRCVHSSDLYPGIVFAALPWADPRDAKNITIALLSMRSDEKESSWEVANSFVKVADLFTELGIKPFVPEISWLEVAKKYSSYIGLSALLLLFLIFHSVRSERLVKKRTAQLSEAIAKKNELEVHAKQAQERLIQIERSGVVSQMSAMLAHEVRQPIEALVNYATGLRIYLAHQSAGDTVIHEATDALTREANRISEIVGRVGAYAKNSKRQKELCPVNDLIRSAISTFSHSPKSSGVQIAFGKTDSLTVLADPLEIELVILNLLRNAADAMLSQPSKKILMSVESLRGKAVISVIDTGPPIDEQSFAALSSPMHSTKKDGLGMGLNLCRIILTNLGGRLQFEKMPRGGLKATILLPTAEQKNQRGEIHEAPCPCS